MQIHLIHVEGFGPLYKRDIGPFSPRVNVVIGPNEAGKSALRAFIRTVLLGFPRAGTLEDRNFGYPPVDGVAHGGAIEFLKSDGLVFAVERNRRSRGPYTGVVRVTVGQESGGEEMLSELLPHLGGRVYQNVFSLSLDELQGLDSEVQERIWSAGFGSTGVIINEVRNRLAREQAEVGKLLNEEKRHLTEAVRSHAEARAELARYSELSEEVRKLEKQKYEISTQIGERRGRLARLELLKVTRPALDQMNEIQRAMTTLPRLNGVSNPARIQDEYDRERKRREQLESELQGGDQQAELRSSRIQQLAGTMDILEFEIESARLLDRKTEYQNAVSDRQKLFGELQAARDAVRQSLAELGPAFDEHRIARLDASVSSRERLDRLDRRLGEAERDEQDAVRREAEAARRVGDASATVVLAEARLSAIGEPESKPAEELRQRRGKVDRLRALKLRANDRHRELEDTRLKLQTLARGTSRLPRRLAFGQLAGSGLASLLGATIGILAWVNRDSALMNIGIAIAVIGASGFALAVALVLTMRREEMKPAETEEAALEKELKLTAQLLGRDIEEVESEAGRIVGMLGYEQAPAEWQLAEEANSLSTAADRQGEYERASADSDTARKKLLDAEAEHQKLAAVSGSATRSAGAARAAWLEWLSSMELPSDIAPRTALAILGQADASRQRIYATRKLEERIVDMTVAVQEIEAGIRQVAAAARIPEFQENQAGLALNRLGEVLETARAARAEMERLEAEAEIWVNRRTQLATDLESTCQAIRSALKEIGADTEDDFIRALQGAAVHRELSEKVQALRIASPGLSSSRSPEIIAELNATTIEALEQEMVQVQASIRELEDRQADLNAKLGELRGQQQALQGIGRTAELSSLVAAHREEALRLRDRVAVRWMATQLIDQTIEDFRRDHQPEQLRLSSRYFSRLTGQRYLRVQPTINGGSKDGSFEGVAADGTTRPVNEMSRGTREQLYLAMRFALMDEFASRQEPMPVIMDDVLVNFDPERARAACAAIRELSERHQVLFLTCHPQTVEQFTSLAASVGSDWLKVIDMPGPRAIARAANRPDPPGLA